MRNLEQELICIEKEYKENKKLIQRNTFDLFEKCKDLIIFHVRKNLILEKAVQVEMVMRCALVDVLGDKVLDNFDYKHSFHRCVDGLWSCSTFFLSWYFIENKLDSSDFLELVVSHIKGCGFNIDYSQTVTRG